MKRLAAVLTVTILLAALAGAQDMEPLPFPVPLNHFFLVVDSATYAAIEDSRFLRTEFAVFERRTTVRADRTYTGVYFYGTNTYFEFFDVAKEAGRQVGDSGVAFGVDSPGGLQALQARLSAGAPQVITRQLGERQVPWFSMIAPKDFPLRSGLSAWVMEYHPRFLSEWHPEADGLREGIRREQILSRYAATLRSSSPPPLLQDVVGLTIAVDEATAGKMTAMCRALGYRARQDGALTELAGPDVVLRLIPSTASARGIRQVDFRVRRMPDEPEYRLGPKSVLKFRGKDAAVWSF